MKKIITLLVVLAAMVSCKKAEESKPAPAPDKKKKFEMYSMSEMSMLMEQMYVDNQRLKEKIKNGEDVGAFPNHFMNIHKAAMTDDAENDAFFKEQAAAFIKAQRLIYEDPANAKAHFNKGVDACLKCHEVKCGGPIPRIKKLYID